MLREAILSAILHLFVIILLITGLPHLFQRPVEPTPIIPVEIVNIADVTQAPLPKAKIDPAPPPPMPQPEPEPEKKVEEKKLEPLENKPVESKLAEPKPEIVPNKDAINDLMKEMDTQPKEDKKEPKKETSKDKKKPKKDFMSVLQSVEKIEKTAIAEGNADISPHNIQNISDVMTATEIDLIRQQLKERWFQQGADRDLKGLRVDIYVEINSDATVRTARITGSNFSLVNPIYKAFANSALRAVMKPEPLKIPPDRRGELKTFTITFRPEDMY